MSYTVEYKTGRPGVPDRAIVTDASGKVIGSVQPDVYGQGRGWEAWRPARDGSWECVGYGATQEAALDLLGFTGDGR